MFIGEKDDVTDTAVSAVAQHLLMKEVCLQFEVKGKTCRLEVVEVQEQAVPEIQQSKQAAEFLGYGEVHFKSSVSCLPSFPKPRRAHHNTL